MCMSPTWRKIGKIQIFVCPNFENLTQYGLHLIWPVLMYGALIMVLILDGNSEQVA